MVKVVRSQNNLGTPKRPRGLFASKPTSVIAFLIATYFGLLRHHQATYSYYIGLVVLFFAITNIMKSEVSPPKTTEP